MCSVCGHGCTHMHTHTHANTQMQKCIQADRKTERDRGKTDTESSRHKERQRKDRQIQRERERESAILEHRRNFLGSIWSQVALDTGRWLVWAPAESLQTICSSAPSGPGMGGVKPPWAPWHCRSDQNVRLPTPTAFLPFCLFPS